MDKDRLNDKGVLDLVHMFQAVSLDPDPVSSTRLFVQAILEYDSIETMVESDLLG